MKSPGVVTADQVAGLLAGTCPWVSKAFHEVALENEDDTRPGGRLGYLDASWIVDRLVDRLAAGNTEGFDELFDLIERLVVEGDDYVSALGVVGYLEGMQSQAVTSRGIDPEELRPWLRSFSLRYWDAIDDFWQNGTIIPDLRSQ